MKLSVFNLFVLVLFVFSSCQKNDLLKESDKDVKKEDWKQETFEGDKDEYDKECFELVYPLTYAMPDGSEVSGEKEEVWGAIKAWYEANSNSEEKPSLQYPVEVIYKDEISKMINNEEEMILSKKDCYDKDEYDKECFELVYPLTYAMPDGSEVSGEKEEVWGAIKTWYEANPNSEEKPALQYPAEIIYKDEISKTINNEEEMILAKKDCYDKSEYDEVCFGLVYPVTFAMPDGAEVSGDKEEVWGAVKVWYENNPESEEKPVLQYPVEVIYKDGETATIDDEDAMGVAKVDCEVGDEENGG